MFPILQAGSDLEAASLPAFVVARDGLYLRKRSLLGVSQTKVGRIAHLPAGSEFVDYALPRVPADLMARVVGFFRAVYRLHQTEAAVLLVWRDGVFDLVVPPQKVTAVSVSFDVRDGDVPPGWRVVGSMHSHGAYGAYASTTDEDDEAELDGLHVVVGDLERRSIGYAAAIVVDGVRFDLKASRLFERPRRFVEPPADWLARVTRGTPAAAAQGQALDGRVARPGVPTLGRDREAEQGRARCRHRQGEPDRRLPRVHLEPLARADDNAGAGRGGRRCLAEWCSSAAAASAASSRGRSTRYLANRPVPQPVLVLVDGDRFEPSNLTRQACTAGDLGTNKAEALARVAGAVGLGVQVVADHVTTDNVGHLVREGDIVLLAVDNHAARALLDRHVATLRDATLISGGNDETDGNVQVVRRRNGWSALTATSSRSTRRSARRPIARRSRSPAARSWPPSARSSSWPTSWSQARCSTPSGRSWSEAACPTARSTST